MNALRSRILHSSACSWALALALAGGSAAQPAPAPEAARPPRPPRAATAPPAPPAPIAPPVAPGAPRAPRLSGGYLGVELVDLTPELREHFGAPREVGVMVGRVEAGSPAARAGLEVADVVVRIGEEPVHDSWGFSGEVSSREGGESIALAVVRDRRERRIDATLERREREAVDIGRWIFPPTPPPGPPRRRRPRRTPPRCPRWDRRSNASAACSRAPTSRSSSKRRSCVSTPRSSSG